MAADKRPTKRRRNWPQQPVFRGWLSTDADEITRREWRGRTEIDDVAVADAHCAPFCDYQVTSSNGNRYAVEVRAFGERINSCECRDFATNGLGTCKHIEGVVQRVRRRGRSATSPRIEVYVDERRGRSLRLAVPDAVASVSPALAEDMRHLCSRLRRGSRKALGELKRTAEANPDALRVSRRLDAWLDARRAAARRVRDRTAFETRLATGERSIDDLLRRPLLPYQVDGVLHLAFGERALLADDMGLGKTVQAIAACALLKELRGIERVLVVSPASLKAEWEEQIRLFSDLPATAVFGNAAERRRQYRGGGFFTLCNYEQVLADGDDLPALVRPDVIVLDEAQRIKNLQTKTAAAIKKLDSRYAFVLTGTPLENRIDELYSILQFVDPSLLGPLFRFNRDFYELDDRGRPVGYRNLDELAERVSTVMLRRRKEDVESELPGRTAKTFFVTMTETQRSLYSDYEHLVGRLAAIAARRPLTKEEFEKLQRYLACMRMVCDTTYILDDQSRDCPKMGEIERLLPELLADPARKIIVFSEWVRMLSLVREYASDAGLEFAWHTGQVPQQRRRGEIRRFREDPDCRLFLSSESGGVGLNLQAADTVINLDQPWNPARLEQRIARAWRKRQKRPVTVINLVSEDTIEHRMLALLEQKRALADAVLDRQGDPALVKMPNSRSAFLERLNQVLDHAPPAVPTESEPIDMLRDDLVALHGAALHRILARDGEDGVLIVVSLPPERIAEEQDRLAERFDVPVSVIDQTTHEAMLRLAGAGFVAMPTEGLREVFPGPEAQTGNVADRRRKRADALVQRARRKFKAATLLEGGGFAEEALAPAAEAARFAAGAIAALRGLGEPDDAESAAAFLARTEPDNGFENLPHGVIGILSGDHGDDGIAPVGSLIDQVDDALRQD
ncbi:MAG: DEAD/DEAH box helicase [Gammaproteobacteria bacterium]|nr:DEAD/DEAH box helicase [Gammaproteobacteria bacterium]